MLVQSDMLESFCDEILNLDPKIRIVGVIDDRGRLLVENKKQGPEIFLDSKSKEIFLTETALGVRMRREHDEHLGSMQFSISCSDRFNSIIFPWRTEILYIFTEKECNMLKIVLSIFAVFGKNTEGSLTN